MPKELTWRKVIDKIPGASPTLHIVESEEEEQYDIVSLFGMLWKKDGVEWAPMPKLLGMQRIGAQLQSIFVDSS